MGFSKWEKFVLILIAIGILLNICIRVKVFGAYSVQGINDNTYNLPDAYANYKYLIVITPSRSWDWTYIYASNTEFVVTNNSSNSSFNIGFPSASVSYAYSQETDISGTNLSRLSVNTSKSPSSLKNGISDISGNLQYHNIVVSTFNLKKVNGDSFFNATVDNTVYPYFSTTDDEINKLSFSKLYIEPADYGTQNPLFLHTLQITQTIPENSSTIYYYTDNIIRLDNTSPYYTQYLDSDYYYYGVPRRKLGFQVDSVYLLVLSNSSDFITNSVGPITKDESNGIYEAVSVNTENIYTYQQVIDDNIQNIDDTLNDNIISSDTETDIEDSLKFDNKNDGLNNLNNGFFSRLTSMLSNLLGYNLADDTSVNIPLPNSNKTITLHSKDIYDNVTGGIRLIINAFWVYIFCFYMWRFINKIYIAVSTGNILDNFSSSGEAITNNML